MIGLARGPRGLDVLEQEFEILGEVGRGGLSIVYLARDRQLEREVAIKVVREGSAQEEESAARLQREARVLASLSHPNIVTVHGARPLPDGGIALVMQYLRGCTLREALHRDGRFPVERAQEVLQQIASALVYLHERGIVHRDVKPENIFVDDESGRTLLSDFSIAKSLYVDSGLTMVGGVIGTPAYMAPEQIEGGPVDCRCDIYSLGLVGHEMLSGRRPWEGESLYAIVYKQKHEALPALDQIRRGIPRRLRATIEAATQKDPDRRTATVREFLAQIGVNTARGNAPPPRLVTTEPGIGNGATGAETIAFIGPPFARTTAPAAPSAASSPDAVEAEPAATGDAAADAEWLPIATPDDDDPVAPAPAPLPRPGRWRRAAPLLMVLVAVLLVGAGAEITMRLTAGTPGGSLAGMDAANAAALHAPPERAPAGRARTPAAPPTTDALAAATLGIMQRLGSSSGTAATGSPGSPAESARGAAVPAAGEADGGAADPRPVGRLPEALQTPPMVTPAVPQLPTTLAVDAPPRVAEPAPSLPPRGGPGAGAGPAAPSTHPPTLKNREQLQQELQHILPFTLATLGAAGGTVVLEIAVDEEGNVQQSRVKTTSGRHELDDAALEAARVMRFSPAQSAGRPVRGTIEVPIVFAPPSH